MYRISASLSVWIIFLISPIIAVLYAFRYPKAYWVKNVIWMMVAFHGMTMPIIREGLDANRYKEALHKMAKEDLSFEGIVNALYNDETRYVDVMQPMVTYLVSIFTANETFLFLVFGLIFGYFYSRNLWFLIQQSLKRKLDFYAWVLLIIFALIVAFWQINAFRFWTAAHIFFLGTIQIFYYKRQKGWLFILLSLLTHYAFIIPVVLLVFHFFYRIPYQILFFIFLATFSISEVDFGALNERLKSYTPSFLEHRVDAYVSEEYAEKRASKSETRSWHAKFYGKALKWSIFVLIAFLYVKRKPVFGPYLFFGRLFSFTLLLYSFANIASMVPSGARYMTVTNLFAMGLLFLVYISVGKSLKMNRVLLILTPFLLFYGLVSLRSGADYMGIDLILSNPLIASVLKSDIALIEFVK
ncbi:hypothetical protein [Negadavirga shengliensis]|uniref:EpsG family protein n=1 Tax=Negadavirga shengliensis TaxID=1389218 RepID=A0ABV9SZC5_9BACT